MIKNFKFIVIQSENSKHVFWLLKKLYPNEEILSLSEKIIIKSYSKSFKNHTKVLYFLFPGAKISKIFISICLQDFGDTILEIKSYKFNDKAVLKNYFKLKTGLQNTCFRINKMFNLSIENVFYEKEFKNLWEHKL